MRNPSVERISCCLPCMCLQIFFFFFPFPRRQKTRANYFPFWPFQGCWSLSHWVTVSLSDSFPHVSGDSQSSQQGQYGYAPPPCGRPRILEHYKVPCTFTYPLVVALFEGLTHLTVSVNFPLSWRAENPCQLPVCMSWEVCHEVRFRTRIQWVVPSAE